MFEPGYPVNKLNYYNLIFLIVVVTLLVLAIISFKRFHEQKSCAALVTSSYEAKLQIERSFAMLRDAEAGQRGYIITRDSSFLIQVRNAQGAIASLVSSLDTIARDSRQSANMAEYRRLIQTRLKVMDRVISSVDADPEFFKSLLDSGRTYSDQARQKIQDLMDRENEIMNHRIDVLQNEESKTSLFILLLSLFALTVLVFSFFRIKKEATARIMQEFNTRYLEGKVDERTGDLEVLSQKLNQQNLQLEKQTKEIKTLSSKTN